MEAARTSKLRVSVSINLFGQAIRLIAGTIGGLAIAAIIGPEAKGSLALLGTICSILALVLGVSLGGALTHRLSSRVWSYSQVLSFVSAWTVLVSVVLFALSFVPFSSSTLARFDPSLSPMLVGIGAIAVLLGAMVAGVQIGAQDYVSLAWSTALIPLSQVGGFFLLGWIGLPYGIAALYGWVLGNICGAGPGLYLLIRKSGGHFHRPHDVVFVFRWALQAAGAALINLVNLRLDVLIISVTAGLRSAGIYALAVQFAEVVWIVPSTVGTVVFPRVAARPDLSGDVWSSRVSRLTLLVSVGAALLVGTSATLLTSVFMRSYVDAVIVLWLLLPGTVGYSIAKVIGNDLYGRGRPDVHLKGAFVSALVTIVGDLSLIPMIGIKGAAIASTVAYSVYAWYLLRRHSQITGTPMVRSVLVKRTDLMDLWREARAVVKRPSRGRG